MTDNQNEQNGHIDGDDYTWQAGPVQAGAVFIPDAQPGTADAWAERWQRQAARANGAALELPAELAADGWQLHQAAGPDLRTADQVERDDVAALHRRLAALEATVAMLVKVLEVRLP